MTGYTPVFRSVFTGSLCGKFPDLPLWLVLLAMADKNGEVDAHPSYIATVSGIALELVTDALARFCEPDPSSRTPDCDGRRLEPLDGRGFGWRIVNHGKYREKARLEAKSAREVAEGLNAKRMQDRRRPPETAGDPLSNANANADSKTLRFSSSESLTTSQSGGVQRGNRTMSKAEERRSALRSKVHLIADGKKFP